MEEHFGVTTKDLRREWDAAEQDLICAEEERARDAAREGKASSSGRRHPQRGDEQPSESTDSTFHTRNSVADGSILRECT